MVVALVVLVVVTLAVVAEAVVVAVAAVVVVVVVVVFPSRFFGIIVLNTLLKIMTFAIVADCHMFFFSCPIGLKQPL